MSGYALAQPYGPGVFPQTKIDGKQPAAATDFTFVVDGKAVWRLVSVVFKLTTDGTAGNRYAAVEFQGDNGNAFAVASPTTTVAPSTTAARFAGWLGHGPGEFATGTDAIFGLAPVFLHGGDTVKITVTNKGAADQLSAIELVLDQFSTDPDLMGAV